ncbi:hypothetical protein ADP71_16640 [Vitreoscilla sp. C1]|uniref:DUF6642 family protein n=1 Tax=Vitreoscilla sp. (strain C1) TaxID=96942 RepID=UPI000CDCC498|nr:DUF6642 family protein [Vitreoscilla sp. C1]AUZ05195.1 hypothetical protein ADP71_16640 [Vitreoscilla sp. C1]
MSGSQPKLRHVFCLEGDWNSDLRAQSSILAGLELVKSINDIDYIYKTCITSEEFYQRLDCLLAGSHTERSKYGKFKIVYLAFHGDEGCLYLSENSEQSIELNDFVERYAGCFSGKIIHFGSCETLNLPEAELRQLLRQLDADALVGYTTEIDFLSSTLVDLLFFEICQAYTTMSAIKSNMFKKYAGLCADLGFVMVHRSS